MNGFAVFYTIFSFCFLFPSSAFISSGLTVSCLCSSWLGSEDLQFIHYQLRRTTATAFFHSLLPFGYFFGTLFLEGYSALVGIIINSNWSLMFFCLAICLPLVMFCQVQYWMSSKWKQHPLAKQLSTFAGDTRQWTDIATEINAEYRRINKVTISTSPVIKVIITDSWIIKVEPYCVHFANQNNSRLELENSEEHDLSIDGSAGAQFLSVRVIQELHPTFTIRLNALDYRDMLERLQGPVSNAQGIAIHQDVHERFSRAFIDQVRQNPVFHTQEEMEDCLGCGVNRSNVRLVRQCGPSTDQDCIACSCRPMWCVQCLSKWFSSRQDADRQETWLASRCPCPTCRNPFCLLDVCFVEHVQNI